VSSHSRRRAILHLPQWGSAARPGLLLDSSGAPIGSGHRDGRLLRRHVVLFIADVTRQWHGSLAWHRSSSAWQRWGQNCRLPGSSRVENIVESISGHFASIVSRNFDKSGKDRFFIHDSLHTANNMQRKFDTVWPVLRPGSVLVADDIHCANAFLEMQKHSEVASSAAPKERDKLSYWGIVVRKQAGAASVQ
jgi:hypothetical protein